MPVRRILRVGGERIRLGQTRDIRLKISETYTGEPVSLPIRVMRSRHPGPIVFLTAALHGDEVNGTGIIRELVFDQPPLLRSGALICAPVLNVFGFESNERYMPDRRDLNRSFPGSNKGSLTARLASMIMDEIVTKSDFGIDLHSAAARRTNYPNVRGNLRLPGVRRLARAFGCEMIVKGEGPEGSMRRAAGAAGCPTIILEAGGISKIEPAVVQIGIRGIQNVLVSLEMIKGKVLPPPFQTIISKTTWVRAEVGGLLRFHIAPGDTVHAGKPIAHNESVFGDAQTVLIAPVDGLVLGMATHPAVKPGEPVCHIAIPDKSLKGIERAIQASPTESLAARVRGEFSTAVTVSPTIDVNRQDEPAQ